MRILTRVILTNKSVPQIVNILKSNSSRFPTETFLDDRASLYCVNRHQAGHISLTHITLQMAPHQNGLEVRISLHADVGFCIGALSALLGMGLIISCILGGSNRWIPALGFAVLGLSLVCSSVKAGEKHLDRISDAISR